LNPILGADASSSARLLDLLEGNGLIERRRHPEDRHSIIVALTAEGRTLIPGLASARRDNRQLIAGSSEDEVRQATAMLQLMLDN
jgi:DNA-binding MarR family transcriptional regulator